MCFLFGVAWAPRTPSYVPQLAATGLYTRDVKFACVGIAVGLPGAPGGLPEVVEVKYCHQPRAKTKDPPYGNSHFLKTGFGPSFLP